MLDGRIPTFHKKDATVTTEFGKVKNFPIHIHSYCEMILYEAFDGYVNISGKTVLTDAPVATLIIPGDFHEIVVNGKSNSMYRKISFSGSIFEKNNIPKTSVVLKPVSDDSLFFKIYDGIMNNAKNEPLKKVLLQSIICIFIQEGQILNPERPANIYNYGLEAVRIINEKYDEDLNLSSVAKRLSVTPQYLSNVFKANIGMTFSNYLTAVRLQNAEELLTETDESVTDISQICGYKNFSHFIRSFKKIYGLSPSAYRKNSVRLKNE